MPLIIQSDKIYRPEVAGIGTEPEVVGLPINSDTRAMFDRIFPNTPDYFVNQHPVPFAQVAIGSLRRLKDDTFSSDFDSEAQVTLGTHDYRFFTGSENLSSLSGESIDTLKAILALAQPVAEDGAIISIEKRDVSLDALSPLSLHVDVQFAVDTKTAVDSYTFVGLLAYPNNTQAVLAYVNPNSNPIDENGNVTEKVANKLEGHIFSTPEGQMNLYSSSKSLHRAVPDPNSIIIKLYPY